MIDIPGYSQFNQIHTGSKTLAYRGIQNESQLSVILKFPSSSYPTQQELTRLRHEYEILKPLQIQGIVKTYGLEKFENSLALILEDAGEQSLKPFIYAKSIDLHDFLKIAIQLASSLGDLHRQNIIHKDIKPNNIIIDTQNLRASLADFGIASRFSYETKKMQETLLEGTLAYISPEQTGRTNRSVDYRTDFYSLGITFYEMLLQDLPFATTETMELIHSHIAKQPASPHEVNPEIPKPLSDIVMKLIAKSAEDRYQSAYGLKVDLEKSLEKLEQKGEITPFPIGEKDYLGQFRILPKLYGREKEMAILEKSFDHSQYGEKELFLLTGYSGMGKSSLVQQFRHFVIEKKGLFLSGKFDPLRKDIPYFPLFQAFRELVRELLLESKESLKSWEQLILEAIGENGKILTDVIPELELLIGPQPQVQELSPTEAKIRFHFVFQNFVTLFAQATHPLVIFLDDMQWSDSASLNLIQQFLENEDTQHFLLIGSYRDNEVSPLHPLINLVEAWKKEGLTVTELPLSLLETKSVESLLQDSLQTKGKGINNLAEVVRSKTGGNPFFVTLFVNNLYAKQFLEFDFDKGHWSWNTKEIQKLSTTENVINLLVDKIQQLPENLQTLLKAASCIGNRFELSPLAKLHEKSLLETAAELWIAEQEGLIIQQGKETNFYQFQHERIQQAAYSLIEEEKKPSLHFQIGQNLYNQYSPEERTEKVFDIINQLNLGKSLIEDPEKKMELARFNYTAGEKARSSTAFEQAYHYFSIGQELLPEDCWEKNFDFAFPLCLKLSQCAFLSQKFDEAAKLFEFLLTKTRTKYEQAEIHLLQIEWCGTLGRHEQGIKIGLEGMKMFGFLIPDFFDKEKLVQDLKQLREDLRSKGSDWLVNMPEMVDIDKKLGLSLWAATATSLYATQHKTMNYLILQGTAISIQYGPSSFSASGFVGMGMAVRGVLEDAATAYELGKIGVRLCEKFNDIDQKCRTYHTFSFLALWKEPLKDVIPYIRKAFHYGIESGNLIFSGFAISTISTYMFLKDDPLEEVLTETQKALGFVRKKQDRDNIDFLTLLLHIEKNFLGQTKAKNTLSDDHFNEEEFLKKIEERQGLSTLNWFFCLKLGMLFIQGQIKESLSLARKLEQLIKPETSFYNLVEFDFYHALTLLAAFPDFSAQEQKESWKKIQKMQSRLENWTQGCEANFQHKYLLVSAEIARVQEKPIVAIELYQKAAESAQNHDFIKHAALAHELAGRFHLSHQFEKYAKIHLLEACYFYQVWGSTSKVEALQKEFPQFINAKESALSEKGSHSMITITTESQSTEHFSSGLDLLTIMKSSQAISEEIVFSKLIGKLITVLIENAGAEKGSLILEKGGQFFLYAKGSVGQKEATLFTSSPISLEHPEVSGKVPVLPVKILQYVAKTKKPEILDNAFQEGSYTKIPYVLKHKTKSILCAPILNKGEVKGIIYLENNLATGVFTQNRIEIVTFLSAQASISLENARLYETYGHFVPHEFLNLLNKKSILDVQLGDQVQKTMSVLFSDIRSFTTLSEKMTPQENFAFINSYLNQMGPVIRKYNGFIDKYIGDAIMALFDRSADDALQAAIDMLHQLETYNRARKKQGYAPIQIGLGINIGELMLGTIGEHNRMEGTVISDSVNLASRLEGMNKFYGTSIIISEQVLLHLRDATQYKIRFLDRVRVKGKLESIQIYEVFDADPIETRENKQKMITTFGEAYRFYQNKDFSQAQSLFRDCLDQVPHDQVSQVYIERCEKFIQSGTPDNWDGTTQLEAK